MALVPVDNLTVGMVLDADVRDRTGRFLLGAGVELTAKHLRIFRTWGVLEVSIAGVEGEGELARLTDDVDQSRLAAAEAELAPRFRRVDLEHPLYRELFRLAALRRAGHGDA